MVLSGTSGVVGSGLFLIHYITSLLIIIVKKKIRDFGQFFIRIFNKIVI